MHIAAVKVSHLCDFCSHMPVVVKPLRGVHILSLALNLPGPAALMRLQGLGARCTKIEPPSRDPMALYNAKAYGEMHAGVRLLSADLKTPVGQKQLHQALAKANVLLTSFRPSALRKLGLGWKSLHARYPTLSVVTIVGNPGAQAEEPGHDLTYLAQAGLVNGLELPPTLFADMGGALMASEAVLAAMLAQRFTGSGSWQEVALSGAADWLAKPRNWGLTQPNGAVGGAHAGYRVYACNDGRVAIAALEPHFAAALAQAVGLPGSDVHTMMLPATREAVAAFCLAHNRAELDAMASDRDIPLFTLV